MNGVEEPEVELGYERRIRRLEERFSAFNVVGSAGVDIEGSLDQGHAANREPEEEKKGAAGDTGACCVGETCTVVSADVCAGLGGTFLGVGVPCVPNPCGGGACCFDDNSCLVETEAQCGVDGGTYQGDGTDCDPNPCEVLCGGCSYSGFLGVHNYKFQTISVEETVDCASFSGSNSFHKTTFLDPNDGCHETCSEASGTSDCSGACDAGLDPCHKDYSCSGWPGDFNTCFGLFDNAGLGWCTCDAGYVETIVSDSVKTITCDGCALCGGTSSYAITITLSGICSD